MQWNQSQNQHNPNNHQTVGHMLSPVFLTQQLPTERTEDKCFGSMAVAKQGEEDEKDGIHYSSH